MQHKQIISPMILKGGFFVATTCEPSVLSGVLFMTPAERYRKKHPERCRESTRKWLAKQHPDYSKSQIKQWREKGGKAIAKKWRNANRERMRLAAKRYRERHPEKIRLQEMIRRARKLKATINADSVRQFFNRIRSLHRVPCYYCKRKISGRTAHIDHIVPLAKGGSHSSDNLCASCPNCNHQKYCKPIAEWVRTGQQILSL